MYEDIRLGLSDLSTLSAALHTSTVYSAIFERNRVIEAASGRGRYEARRVATDALFAVLREVFDDIEYDILSPED